MVERAPAPLASSASARSTRGEAPVVTAARPCVARAPATDPPTVQPFGAPESSAQQCAKRQLASSQLAVPAACSSPSAPFLVRSSCATSAVGARTTDGPPPTSTASLPVPAQPLQDAAAQPVLGQQSGQGRRGPAPLGRWRGRRIVWHNSVGFVCGSVLHSPLAGGAHSVSFVCGSVLHSLLAAGAPSP